MYSSPIQNMGWCEWSPLPCVPSYVQRFQHASLETLADFRLLVFKPEVLRILPRFCQFLASSYLINGQPDRAQQQRSLDVSGGQYVDYGSDIRTRVAPVLLQVCGIRMWLELAQIRVCAVWRTNSSIGVPNGLGV